MTGGWGARAREAGPRLLIGQEPLIFAMRSNPEPSNAAFDDRSERPVVEPHANRPEVADSLEVERRMFWIRLQKLKVLVCQFADGLREAPLM